MTVDQDIDTPGMADIKASHVVYEDTYNPREKLDDILPREFWETMSYFLSRKNHKLFFHCRFEICF